MSFPQLALISRVSICITTLSCSWMLILLIFLNFSCSKHCDLTQNHLKFLLYIITFAHSQNQMPLILHGGSCRESIGKSDGRSKDFATHIGKRFETGQRTNYTVSTHMDGILHQVCQRKNPWEAYRHIALHYFRIVDSLLGMKVAKRTRLPACQGNRSSSNPVDGTCVTTRLFREPVGWFCTSSSWFVPVHIINTWIWG